MGKKEDDRNLTDSLRFLADSLYKMGNILIEMGERIKIKSDVSSDMPLLANLLKNLDNTLQELEKTKVTTGYYDQIAKMSKEILIQFVKDYYGETIPKSWTKVRVMRQAVDVFNKHGGLEKFKEFITRFQYEHRKEIIQKVDVYSMEPNEIRKVLGEIGHTGGVEAIRKALPSNLKYLLKGVTSTDYAIMKVIDHINRLRAPISTFLQEPRT
jgi:hypothetical protein